MISLGIESTAHTFGIGIMKDKEILADMKSVYKPEKGGIHPLEAQNHHMSVKDSVLDSALKKANIKLEDVDIISYSAGPGLPPALKVGLEMAKSLAVGKPLVPVNHCIAHIELGKLLTKSKNPIVLYVSGGNTQVIGYAAGRYRVFGETQDMAIGNAIDTFMREAGFAHPGGPKMEEKARGGSYIELPYVVKGMDLSFSGILTSAVQKLKRERLEDICFSFQETCFAMLSEVVERALAHTGKKEVLLTGGVAASSRLRDMLNTMCRERGASFYVCPREYAGDNGTMIAWTGQIAKKLGHITNIKSADFVQRWRTDDVKWSTG